MIWERFHGFMFKFSLIFPLFFPDREKKILTKLLDIFSQCSFQVFFDQLGLEPEGPEIKGRKIGCLLGKQTGIHMYSRFFQVFILLRKIVSDNLQIPACFSKVSLADCTQKVPVFDLKSSAR